MENHHKEDRELDNFVLPFAFPVSHFGRLAERSKCQRLLTLAHSNISPSTRQIYSHERMLAIAKQGMAKDEEPFTDEVPLPPSTKRDTSAGKPKYFNRIMSGYDWNRYNKTHFDPENPPPKYIQGYRFNIFYPDLQDMTKAPTFKLFECVGDPSSAILRFSSGPPYEDVAFKIRNEEWDTDRSHGYKTQFQNGILQVWFHYKKLRYRR